MEAMDSSGARLGGIRPLLIVADVVASADFYARALGFELTLLSPEEEPFFAIVQRDDAGLMLKSISPEIQPLPNPVRHPWAKWDAFVTVQDPKALAAEINGRGVVAVNAEATEDGLFGFEVVDQDGYCLFFGRPQA